MIGPRRRSIRIRKSSRPMKPVLGTEISIGGRRWSQKLNDGIETERIVYTIAQRYDLPDDNSEAFSF